MISKDKKARCHRCGKDSYQCGGWLHRINKKGIFGIWECQPSCDAKLLKEERLFAALNHREEVK